MSHFWRAVTAVSALALPLVASIQDIADVPPVPAVAPVADFLPPTRGSVWRLESAENECRIFRSFGPVDNPVILRLARGMRLEQMDVVLAGNRIRTTVSNGISVRVALLPQNEEITSLGFGEDIPDRTERFLRIFDVPAKLFEDAEPIQDVQFLAAGPPITLRLAGTNTALQALQDCHNNLLLTWGISTEERNRVGTPPRPANSESRWVTPDDYPLEAINRNIQGVTGLRLLVGTDGRIQNCIVLYTSGSLLLDEAACTAMTRNARFTPALDREGQPMAYFFLKRVRWILPDVE